MNILKNNNFLTMESLALPRELLWNGKEEPTSPPSSELFPLTESEGMHSDWLTDDDLENGIKYLEGNAFELKAGIEFTTELINGEDMVVELIDLKEENWPESKLDSSALPLHGNTEILPVGLLISAAAPLIKIDSEFELNNGLIFGNRDACTSLENVILSQLTPPHSPPRQHNALPAEFAHKLEENLNNHGMAIYQQTHHHEAQQQQAQPTSSTAEAAATPSAQHANIFNIDFATQIVDEIVNTRAREIFSWQDESQSSCSTPSLADSSSNDEEWLPSSSSDSSFSGLIDDAASSNTAENAGAGKKRKRAYGRAIEDRKIRKKEQNKNAATRYRQKKKLEMEEVLNEEQLLIQRNNELKRAFAERNREAKYLKSLLREFHEKRKQSPLA